MKIKIFIYLLLFGGTYALAKFFVINYSYADFKSYTDVLLNVSGAVFTLMGIWIAFLYPNALSRIVDPKTVETADFSESFLESKRLGSIVGSVMKSAAVVLGVLVMTFLKLPVSAIPALMQYKLEFKYVGLSAALTLLVLQSEAIFGVIYANVMFLNDLHTKRADKMLEDQY